MEIRNLIRKILVLIPLIFTYTTLSGHTDELGFDISNYVSPVYTLSPTKHEIGPGVVEYYTRTTTVTNPVVTEKSEKVYEKEVIIERPATHKTTFHKTIVTHKPRWHRQQVAQKSIYTEKVITKVVEKPIIIEKVTPPKTIVIEKPAKTVVVEKPVVIEKPVIIEKPVPTVRRTVIIEKPAAGTIVEKRVYQY